MRDVRRRRRRRRIISTAVYFRLTAIMMTVSSREGGREEDNLRAQEADIAAMRTCQAPRPLFPSFTMMADGRSDR